MRKLRQREVNRLVQNGTAPQWWSQSIPVKHDFRGPMTTRARSSEAVGSKEAGGVQGSKQGYCADKEILERRTGAREAREDKHCPSLRQEEIKHF